MMNPFLPCFSYGNVLGEKDQYGQTKFSFSDAVLHAVFLIGGHTGWPGLNASRARSHERNRYSPGKNKNRFFPILLSS
jgi:hypothetical protein